MLYSYGKSIVLKKLPQLEAPKEHDFVITEDSSLKYERACRPSSTCGFTQIFYFKKGTGVTLFDSSGIEYVAIDNDNIFCTEEIKNG